MSRAISTPVKDMNNAETAAELRRWCLTSSPTVFSWPTDACGYEQHIRFVNHRNRNWSGGTHGEFIAFVLAYADSLERAQ